MDNKTALKIVEISRSRVKIWREEFGVDDSNLGGDDTSFYFFIKKENLSGELVKSFLEKLTKKEYVIDSYKGEKPLLNGKFLHKLEHIRYLTNDVITNKKKLVEPSVNSFDFNLISELKIDNCEIFSFVFSFAGFPYSSIRIASISNEFVLVEYSLDNKALPQMYDFFCGVAIDLCDYVSFEFGFTGLHLDWQKVPLNKIVNYFDHPNYPIFYVICFGKKLTRKFGESKIENIPGSRVIKTNNGVVVILDSIRDVINPTALSTVDYFKTTLSSK